MNLMPDLFSFAFIPSWYEQLDELAELAIPEPWRFRNPNYYTKNHDTPILERYIHSIFKKQVIDYNEERNPAKAVEYFHVVRLPSSLLDWKPPRRERRKPLHSLKPQKRK